MLSSSSVGKKESHCSAKLCTPVWFIIDSKGHLQARKKGKAEKLQKIAENCEKLRNCRNLRKIADLNQHDRGAGSRSELNSPPLPSKRTGGCVLENLSLHITHIISRSAPGHLRCTFTSSLTAAQPWFHSWGAHILSALSWVQVALACHYKRMAVMRAMHKTVRRVYSASPGAAENTMRVVYVIAHHQPHTHARTHTMTAMMLKVTTIQTHQSESETDCASRSAGTYAKGRWTQVCGRETDPSATSHAAHTGSLDVQGPAGPTEHRRQWPRQCSDSAAI